MKCLMAVGALACSLVAAPPPVMSLRLRGPHTATREQWEKTRQAIAANPGCCDEVWFSTGIGVPPLDWHREQVARLLRAAGDLRPLGIVPSLQFQATLGHSDALSSCEDCSGKTWTGWTGSTGVEDRFCNCPRQPAFLAYIREMARIYARLRPERVWIDDDLRIDNHAPATVRSQHGCWCATCVAAFNAQTGGNWTRATLAAATLKDADRRAQWQAFSIRAIADVARAIADEFRVHSPETRMALQHAFGEHAVASVKALRDALHAASGRPVGLRPGGGFYYDVNPADQIVKAFATARSRKVLDAPCVDVWCPEVESWPRAYGSRSGQSALVESFMSIAYGCNATSLLLLDTRYEKDELYARTILKPLADAAPVLKGYVRANEGTVPAGYAADGLSAAKLYRWALCGIPVLPGWGRNLGDLSADALKLDVCLAGSQTVQEARAAHPAPAVLESPFVGLMVPRLTPAGALKTVALLNTRIDAQGPVVIRFRGGAAKRARWHELRRPVAVLDIRAEGADQLVTIPEIGPWNAGYLDFASQ
ncbi:MAG: hypothetical protein ACI4Q3_07945 [Kiritimatiellia bacterium]